MKKNFVLKILVWSLLAALLLCGCGVNEPLETENTLPAQLITEPAETATPTEPEETQAPTLPEDSTFTVHFIDVGQADAALIICDGETMLIDGGNAADSSLMYNFLQKNGVDHLDYLIATHAHEDHVGGLSGALYYAKADTVFSPTKSYSSAAFQNFANNVKNQGKSITVPNVGTQFPLGSAVCTVLAVNTTSDINNTSIVLRIVYGNTSFLFTGDAEREVEKSMIDRGVTLQSTVLKVGHHGSSSSSSYAFLRSVMPEYAVISCGKGNDYGHPHEEVLSRFEDAEVKLYRTDLQGNITCTSDGNTVTFSVSHNENADVFSREDYVSQGSSSGTYILNTNSMKFHDADCEWASQISQKNRKDYTGSREELISQGYAPCGSCHP